jgi:hypothetical protein
MPAIRFCAFGSSLLSALIYVCACSSTIPHLTFARIHGLNPVALYVVASSQILENNDSDHNDFIVEAGGDFLLQMLRVKGYEPRPLNVTLKREEVFRKYPATFYINEQKIAAIAKESGSASVLIVYFAYIGQRPSESRFYSDLSCSLYGWLIDSKDGSVIANSHTKLNSYQSFLAENPSATTLAADLSYRHFLEAITFTMFGGMPKLSPPPGVRTAISPPPRPKS